MENTRRAQTGIQKRKRTINWPQSPENGLCAHPKVSCGRTFCVCTRPMAIRVRTGEPRSGEPLCLVICQDILASTILHSSRNMEIPAQNKRSSRLNHRRLPPALELRSTVVEQGKGCKDFLVSRTTGVCPEGHLWTVRHRLREMTSDRICCSRCVLSSDLDPSTVITDNCITSNTQHPLTFTLLRVRQAGNPTSLRVSEKSIMGDSWGSCYFRRFNKRGGNSGPSPIIGSSPSTAVTHSS
ncbi:hypothetical protein RRG08_032208 [Elysia crispata]|uniref:Uncharacterized protein n=1 Tax=Elysia crispata TaxID=231223 RepID=A0AAE1DWB5_9GAST|nr:hypothetical protein RRG08_032208 [Elysia crispata]